MPDRRTAAVRFPTAPPRHCKWCGEAISLGRKDRRWHDGRGDEPDCLTSYLWESQTTRMAWGPLAARDGERCDECGWPMWCSALESEGDAKLIAWVAPFSAGLRMYDFDDPYNPRSYGPGRVHWLVLLGHRLYGGPWAKTRALEVDHRLALVDGGTNVLENLHFLCHWCHKAKTSAEATARAARRRAEKAARKDR